MRRTSTRRTNYQDDYESMPPEEIEGPVYEGEMEPYPEWDGYPGEFGGCSECGGCGECDACCNDCYGGCDWLWYENLEVFAGGHAFKGPLDLGRNGNFGLGYGVNWGGPLWNALSIGYQIGFQAVHSNFYGDQILDPLGNDARNQYFITTGLFHRPRNGHLQYGLAFDWLQDDYYVDAQLSQIRAEISILGAWSNEIGFRATGGTGEDSILPTLGVGTSEQWEPTDQYVFFIRRRFCTGAEGRLWAGFTGKSDGLFGGDVRMPLSPSLAMQVNFGALFPDEGRGPIGAANEAWGGTINLVWYPGATAQSATRSLWRPLFTVADNSTMFFDRKSINP